MLLLEKSKALLFIICFVFSALHIAAGAQHSSSVEVLLQHGAQSVPDKTGTTPRLLARKKQVTDVFDRHLVIT